MYEFVADVSISRHPHFRQPNGAHAAEVSTLRRDWKGMWKVRKALHSRWADGYAAAIYLEGHQDTVYCVQFDKLATIPLLPFRLS